jgi:hypothetical protein
MKINCTTTFKEGRETFHEGDQRTVSDEDGARFIANGWAVAAGDAPQPLPDLPAVDLSIDSATHATGDSNG